MLTNFRTFQISRTFYNCCRTLKLPTHLQDQLLRASSSICLNLAEGYGKIGYKDQRRFFQIANGSLRESQAVLLIVGLENSEAYQVSNHLGACLYKLINTQKRGRS